MIWKLTSKIGKEISGKIYAITIPSRVAKME